MHHSKTAKEQNQQPPRLLETLLEEAEDLFSHRHVFLGLSFVVDLLGGVSWLLTLLVLLLLTLLLPGIVGRLSTHRIGSLILRLAVLLLVVLMRLWLSPILRWLSLTASQIDVDASFVLFGVVV